MNMNHLGQDVVVKAMLFNDILNIDQSDDLAYLASIDDYIQSYYEDKHQLEDVLEISDIQLTDDILNKAHAFSQLLDVSLTYDNDIVKRGVHTKVIIQSFLNEQPLYETIQLKLNTLDDIAKHHRQYPNAFQAWVYYRIEFLVNQLNYAMQLDRNIPYHEDVKLTAMNDLLKHHQDLKGGYINYATYQTYVMNRMNDGI